MSWPPSTSLLKNYGKNHLRPSLLFICNSRISSVRFKLWPHGPPVAPLLLIALLLPLYCLWPPEYLSCAPRGPLGLLGKPWFRITNFKACYITKLIKQKYYRLINVILKLINDNLYNNFKYLKLLIKKPYRLYKLIHKKQNFLEINCQSQKKMRRCQDEKKGWPHKANKVSFFI